MGAVGLSLLKGSVLFGRSVLNSGLRAWLTVYRFGCAGCRRSKIFPALQKQKKL